MPTVIKKEYSNYEEYGLTIKKPKPELAEKLIRDGWILSNIKSETNISGTGLKKIAKDLGYTFGKQGKMPAHRLDEY